MPEVRNEDVQDRGREVSAPQYSAVTTYPLSGTQEDELQARFTYHAPNPDQVQRMARIRRVVGEAAREVTLLTPTSREQSLALTALEEVSMWANAAIARREPHDA